MNRRGFLKLFGAAALGLALGLHRAAPLQQVVAQPPVPVQFAWHWKPRIDSFDDKRRRVAIVVGRPGRAISWIGRYGTYSH